MNILVILDDALRARNLGCYGYPKPTSPNCDRLAAEGVRFETCIAVSAHTFPPVVSLMTGRTTFAHGLVTARDYADWRRRAPVPTPLHALVDAGYRVDGEMVTRWAPLGFARDRDDLDAYLDAHTRDRWFYVAEPYPTHLPYNPPQSYYDQFVDPGFKPDAAARRRLELVRTRMILHPPGVRSALEAGEPDSIGVGDDAHRRSVAEVAFEPGDEPGVRALYDGEVRVFDDLVGRWLARLEALDLLDDTLVALTADHGEELLERGHVGHSSCNLMGTLHDECLRVPLILRYPRRLPAGALVRAQVSQIDLMPTIFDLLDLEMPGTHEGASLLPLVTGAPAGFRAEAYAETPPAGWQALPNDRRRLLCVRTADWKLIVRRDLATGRERAELYDLGRDPLERRDVLEREPGVAARLRAVLDRANAGKGTGA